MAKRSWKGVKMAGGFLVLLAVAFMLYVRFAPSDPSRWNQPVAATSDADRTGGAVRVFDGGTEAFARIDEAARALPRTDVLAGSLAEGRITYITRSRVFGFPDYTTVEMDGDTIRMYARLRFGSSDLGVNRARLEQLLAAAERG
jgi:uncharacterized protein (DUF1499 family)